MMERCKTRYSDSPDDEDSGEITDRKTQYLCWLAEFESSEKPFTTTFLQLLRRMLRIRTTSDARRIDLQQNPEENECCLPFY